ncbi:MAG: hypothetical protein VX828_03635, partial [Candidatus Thermoplasmatota archaeon]|nr:hypothetical protein [Candidatus Thermoplasmatota archaeon]
VDKATLDFSAVFNNCRCLVNAWIPCGWSCSVNPAAAPLDVKARARVWHVHIATMWMQRYSLAI